MQLAASVEDGTNPHLQDVSQPDAIRFQTGIIFNPANHFFKSFSLTTLGMAVLKIIRSNEHTNRLRDIKIFLNNTVIGTIANSSTEEFTIEPGRHSLFAKIDWCSSEIITLEVTKNETIVFDLMSFAKGKYPNGLAALYYTILKPDRFLILSPASLKQPGLT